LNTPQHSGQPCSHVHRTSRERCNPLPIFGNTLPFVALDRGLGGGLITACVCACAPEQFPRPCPRETPHTGESGPARSRIRAFGFLHQNSTHHDGLSGMVDAVTRDTSSGCLSATMRFTAASANGDEAVGPNIMAAAIFFRDMSSAVTPGMGLI